MEVENELIEGKNLIEKRFTRCAVMSSTFISAILAKERRVLGLELLREVRRENRGGIAADILIQRNERDSPPRDISDAGKRLWLFPRHMFSSRPDLGRLSPVPRSSSPPHPRLRTALHTFHFLGSPAPPGTPEHQLHTHVNSSALRPSNPIFYPP